MWASGALRGACAESMRALFEALAPRLCVHVHSSRRLSRECGRGGRRNAPPSFRGACAENVDEARRHLLVRSDYRIRVRTKIMHTSTV